MSIWVTYILECSDGTLYTGVTTDIERRLHEHNNTKQGAKYTKGRRPVSLQWISDGRGQGEAKQLEYTIKQLSREEKENLVSGELKESELIDD